MMSAKIVAKTKVYKTETVTLDYMKRKGSKQNESIKFVATDRSRWRCTSSNHLQIDCKVPDDKLKCKVCSTKSFERRPHNESDWCRAQAKSRSLTRTQSPAKRVVNKKNNKEEKVRVTTDEESRSRSRGRKLVKDKRLKSKNSKKVEKLVKDLGKLLKRVPTPHSPAGDSQSGDSHTSDGGSASETIQLVTCEASSGSATGKSSPDRSSSPHPWAESPRAS